MIILDTETTGHLKPEVASLDDQPYIIEIAALKVNGNFKRVDELCSLVNPNVPFDEATHRRITGITEKQLADAPLFIELADRLTDFFLGERTMIAHNCEFDRSVLALELRRLGREHFFPWPPVQICTVERTKHQTGSRLSLKELYEKVFGRKLAQTHRAREDAMALLDIVRELKMKE
jgi:DNA polymerase III subunit epsilon